VAVRSGAAPDGYRGASPPSSPAPLEAELERAAALLAGAVRPVVIAGLGCRPGDAPAWLRALVEALPAPALATIKGKGALPDPHPLAFGVLPVAPSAPALLARADLVVAIGVDPGEPGRAPLPGRLPVLDLAPAIDPGAADEPAQPAGGGPPLARVRGDVGAVLAELPGRLGGRTRADWDVAELDRLKRGRARAGEGALSPLAIVEVAREVTPAGGIAVACAAFAEAAIRGWQAVGPGQLVVPAVLAPAGFGAPAAVAAAVARRDVPVIGLVEGVDVAAGRPALELAVDRRLPVVILAAGPPSDLPAGVRRLRVADRAALAPALAAALAPGARGPAVVELPPV
jgi:acetolactate synthase-1/2/3 large subunit